MCLIPLPGEHEAPAAAAATGHVGERAHGGGDGQPGGLPPAPRHRVLGQGQGGGGQDIQGAGEDDEDVMDVWQVEAEMVDGFHSKLYSTKKDAAQE